MRAPNSVRRIHIDPATFDPSKLQAFTHALADHPLLELDALVELGRRQQQRALIRTHSIEATASTDFDGAPSLHPNQVGTSAIIENIANARAWMLLRNVHADPIYGRFVDELFDEVRPAIEPRDPGMYYRAGWIFVSSPGAVTPFHIDRDSNFLMQIRGTKRLYTWAPDDRVVVSEQAHEQFHTRQSRELVTWREEFRARAQIFELEPGRGCYMPSLAPHMVETGPEPSITISLTYYTDATRRREAQLPQPVGASPRNDRIKATVLSGYVSAHNLVRRALGQPVKRNDPPYA